MGVGSLQNTGQEIIDATQNHTYQDLLDSLDHDFACQNSEFIEINKQNMIFVHLGELDYRFFWGCMKLYDALGFNYFQLYLAIVKREFGNFSGGIEHWMDCSYGYSQPSGDHDYSQAYDCLSLLIEALRFFGLDCYDGMSILELQTVFQALPILRKAAYQTVLQQRIEKGQQTKRLAEDNASPIHQSYA